MPTEKVTLFETKLFPSRIASLALVADAVPRLCTATFTGTSLFTTGSTGNDTSELPVIARSGQVNREMIAGLMLLCRFVSGMALGPDVSPTGGLTTTENRAHFSMWALLAAPLLAGNDIEHMSADTKEILLNKEVIAIDQDALGQQGRRVKKTGDLEIWSKQLADGGRAIALLNRGNAAAKIDVAWSDIGYPNSVSASVRDLWAKKDVGRKTGGYSAEVPSHGVVMVRVTP